MQVILSWTTFRVAISACVAIFPLQPNQTPDFCLSAALTATSSPPARAVAFLSGIATLLETIISCPKWWPFRSALQALQHNKWKTQRNVPLLLEVVTLGVRHEDGGTYKKDTRKV